MLQNPQNPRNNPQNLPPKTGVSSAIHDFSANTINRGLTGITRVNRGDMIFANKINAEFFSKLGIGNEGTFLTVKDGLPKWGSSSDLMNALTGVSFSTALTVGKIFQGSAANITQEATLSSSAGVNVFTDVAGAKFSFSQNQAYMLSRASLRI